MRERASFFLVHFERQESLTYMTHIQWQKLSKIVKDCQELPIIGKNLQKWQELAEIARIGPPNRLFSIATKRWR